MMSERMSMEHAEVKFQLTRLLEKMARDLYGADVNSENGTLKRYLTVISLLTVMVYDIPDAQEYLRNLDSEFTIGG